MVRCCIGKMLNCFSCTLTFYKWHAYLNECQRPFEEEFFEFQSVPYLFLVFRLAESNIPGRLQTALKACARYIYGISRYQHISKHANRILGCSLDTYYNLSICCAMYRLIGSGRPRCLFDGLQFGLLDFLFSLYLVIVRLRSCGMVCHHCSEYRAAWGGLRMSVFLICVYLQLLVMCEFFFFLFLLSVSFLFSFGSE
jgi:hypothetical protein